MVEALTLVAAGLLLLGVVGSVVPALPGALLSVGGVLLYWWSTGYADPSTPVLAGLVVVGLLAAAVDYFGGAVAAGMGGASKWTVAAAGLVGFVLFFVVGPLGVIMGVGGTVFALELVRHGDARQGGTTALYAVVGILGSALVQVLLTASMLVAFVLVVLL